MSRTGLFLKGTAFLRSKFLITKFHIVLSLDIESKDHLVRVLLVGDGFLSFRVGGIKHFVLYSAGAGLKLHPTEKKEDFSA